MEKIIIIYNFKLTNYEYVIVTILAETNIINTPYKGTK